MIENCRVTVQGDCADVLISPFGHIFVDSGEKTLRPITPATTERILQCLRTVPRATADLMDRVERIAELVYPSPDDDDFAWLWELDTESEAHHICATCGN
jgi:hypothetical protein